MMISLLLYSLLLVIPTSAKIHELNWRLSYKQVNPDNSSTPCQIISINDQFPPPIIRLKQHDTLRINLYNGLDEPTALHFHGIFQKGFNQMDGPTMLTQCPILPQTHFTYEFTVNQTGTYWYHAHESVQYGDGLRGALIIEEDEQKYDHDVVVTLSDWYYGKSEQLLHDSKGNEPRIDSSLFNDTRDVKWGVEPNEEILIRLINMGMSGSQYFYIEDHNLTIVEVDGVKIQPVEVDSVLLATGQRYGVVLQTKSNRDRNYGMVSITNMMMRKVYLDNWIVYDFAKPFDPPLEIHPRYLNYIDDFQLKPLVTTPRLGTPNHQFEFTYDSIDYQGQNYWTMNGVPHLSPKIPTLMTVLSSGDDEFGNPSIYGNSTNTIIIEKGDIVDIIVNSNDMMKHPFHLHGHNFQVLARERKKHYEHDSSKFPDFPLVRDTIVVPNHGYVVLRFIADNPGVWFFHCHTDWHAATGLGVVFIESPDLIRRDLKLNKESLEMCLKGGVKTRGNAAGNDDFMDLKGDVSIYNMNEKESTSIPTTTSSSLPSPSSTDSMMKSTSSFHTKVVVLIIYFTIMLMIAITGAFFINRRIRSNIHYKKGKYRRLSTIANVEPEQGIEL